MFAVTPRQRVECFRQLPVPESSAHHGSSKGCLLILSSPCSAPVAWPCPALLCHAIPFHVHCLTAHHDISFNLPGLLVLARVILPWADSLCHASKCLLLGCRACRLPCRAAIAISACQAVQSASVLRTGHDSSSCTVSEAPGSCADCAPGASALQAPASRLVGKLPAPIPSVLLLCLQQADVVTMMQCGIPCCLHSGIGSYQLRGHCTIRALSRA